MRAIYGKKAKPVGVTPAIALINPKHARNVGTAIRSASCFGVRQVWFTGERVSLHPGKGERLPREERMKGYGEVDLIQFDPFFDQFPEGTVPIAVEVMESSENLMYFEHPEKALYVFGPEDGGLGSVHLRHCHRFVTIPSRHCLNLATAVTLVLWDRISKRVNAGLEEVPVLAEHRGLEQALSELEQRD